MFRPVPWLVVLLLALPSGGLSILELRGHPHSDVPGPIGASFVDASGAHRPLLNLTQGWTKLASAGGPSARSNASATYDPNLGGVLLFGGWSGSFLSDSWMYRGGVWSPLSLATHPSARAGAVLVFDPSLGASVLFGGTNGKPLSDTWAFQGGHWTLQNLSTAPPARSGAAATYDPFRGGIVIFGGLGKSSFLADTWIFTGTGWASMSEPSHPSAAAYASLAADPSDGYLLLFGGAATGPLSATWALAQGSWTRQNVSHPPPARSAAGLAYDAPDGFLMLFGGRGSVAYGSTWSYDGGAWTALSPTTHPSNRSGMAMVFDAADGYVLLFGGRSTAALGDTWAFKIRTTAPAWTPLAVPSGPHQREQGVTAFDPVDGYTVLFGGWDSTATNLSLMFFNDTWTYKAGVWTALHPSVAPSPRRGAMMVFDASDGYLLLFGGSNATSYLNDTWTFRSGVWTKLVIAHAPPIRRSGAIAFDQADGYVVLFGGHNGSGVLGGPGTPYFMRGDTWSYHRGVWMEIRATAHPSPRAEPEMEFDAADGYVLLFGGYIAHRNGLGDIEQADTWRYLAGIWTNLTLTLAPAPTARDGEVLVYDSTHGYVLMFGGDVGLGAPGDSWSYRAGWTEICANCTSGYRPGSHAAFDSSDGYVVYLGGDGHGRGATVAWVSPLVVKPTAPAAGDAGLAVAFRATTAGAIPPIRYLWTFGDGNLSTLAATSERFPSAGAYHPTLAISDSTGNTGIATMSLAIAAPLGVVPTVAPSATDVNESVTFSANVTGGTPPLSFQWSFGDGGTSSAVAPSHVYASGGNYSGAVVVQDSVGGSSSASFGARVHGGPIPSVLGAPNATDVGVLVNLTAAVRDGSAPYQFLWSFGDGGNGSGSAVDHAYATPGNATITLSVVDAQGASANSSRPIAVHPDPTVQGSVAAIGDVGQNLTFDASVVGGTAPYAVLWQFGDGNSSSSLPALHAYGSPGNLSVVLEVTDAAGVLATWTTGIRVSPALVVSADAAPGPNVTAGTNISLEANVTGGSGVVAYLWVYGDGSPNGTTANVSHAFAGPGNYTVQLFVTDAAGVTSTVAVPFSVSEAGGRRAARVPRSRPL